MNQSRRAEIPGWKKRNELLSQMANPMEDAFLNQIELFVAGALDFQESEALRMHLAAGCTACQHALSENARLFRALPAAWVSVSPTAVAPPGLKQRLLNTIKNDLSRSASAQHQVWKTWPDQSSQMPPLAALLTVHANEGTWEDIGINGITAKRLFVDKKNDSVTMLVRMPPGASYPRHHHGGVEQCYVLEGDICVGDMVFHAGDYQCAATDSIHVVQSTEKGCLLFIISSLHDEIVAA